MTVSALSSPLTTATTSTNTTTHNEVDKTLTTSLPNLSLTSSLSSSQKKRRKPKKISVSNDTSSPDSTMNTTTNSTTMTTTVTHSKVIALRSKKIETPEERKKRIDEYSLVKQKKFLETHCFSCVPFVPSPITYLLPVTIPGIGSWLFVAREKGEIEIYLWEHAWFLERVIPGGKNKSISSMAWARAPLDSSFPKNSKHSRGHSKLKMKKLSLGQLVRLFTSSLNGTITEWDLDKLCPKFTMDVCISGVWSLSVNAHSTQLAVGGEDGSVSIFDLTPSSETTLIQGLPLARHFMYPNHRILCLTWSMNQTSLIAGTDQSKLLKFHLNCNQPTEHVDLYLGFSTADVPFSSNFSTSSNASYASKKQKRSRSSRSHKHPFSTTASASGTPHRSSPQTIVWCVRPWDANHVFAGTSLGTLEIIDLNSFTHFQSIPAHSMDVIQLDMNQLRKHLFSASLDGTVTLTQYSKETKQWEVVFSRKYHEHDIKALAIAYPCKNKAPLLMTGGVDAFINYSELTKLSFDRTNVNRVTHFGTSRVHLVSSFSGLNDQPCIFARMHHEIHVYHFEHSFPTEVSAMEDLNLNDVDEDTVGALSTVRFFVCLRFPPTSTLIDMSVSQDGRWLAVTHSCTQLFRYHHSKYEQWFSVKFPALRCLCFNHGFNPNETFLAGFDPLRGLIHVYKLTELDLMVTSVYTCSSFITNIVFSKHGQVLIASDEFHRISMYDLTQPNRLEPLDWVTLESPITHLSWTPMSNYLCCGQTDVLRLYRCFSVPDPCPFLPPPSPTTTTMTSEGPSLPACFHLEYQCQLPNPVNHVLELSYLRFLYWCLSENQLAQFRISKASITLKRKDPMASTPSSSKFQFAAIMHQEIQGYDGFITMQQPVPNRLMFVVRPFEHILKTLSPSIIKKKFGTQ